jgi:hypothetical protein
VSEEAEGPKADATGAETAGVGGVALAAVAVALRKIFNRTAQYIAVNGARVFQNRSKRRSYPSRRPCPACGGDMFYLPSRWTRRHTRTCENCDYSDETVKIVTQI